MHQPLQASTKTPARSGAGFFFGLATLAGLLILPAGLGLAAEPVPSLPASPAAAPAPSRSELVSRLALAPDLAAAFLRGEALYTKHQGTAPLSLCPLPDYRPALEAALARSRPKILLETLQTMPLPAGLADPAGQPSPLVRLWKLIHQFRSMEGLTYWSVSEQREKVLFLRSRLVKGPRDRQELPDPVMDTLSPGREYTILQEDSRLGSNLYRIQTSQPATGALELATTNLEQLWLGIVPAVPPEGMQTRVLVLLAQDCLVFYGATSLDVMAAFGLDERLAESYRHRFEALYRWLQQQASRL